MSLLISSVLSLTRNSFTAIFLKLLDNDKLHGVLLRHVGLVLDDDDDAGGECRCRQRNGLASTMIGETIML